MTVQRRDRCGASRASVHYHSFTPRQSLFFGHDNRNLGNFAKIPPWPVQWYDRVCFRRDRDGRGLHVQQHRLTPRDPFGRDVAAPARSAYLRLADAVDVRVAARARVRAKGKHLM